MKNIYAHAVETYPEECFGFLLGSRGDATHVREVIRARNTAPERLDRFDMDPEEFVRVDAEATAKGWEIIGVYHSHPEWPALPSQRDLDFGWEAFSYLIVAVHNKKVTAVSGWELSSAGPKRFRPIAIEVLSEDIHPGNP